MEQLNLSFDVPISVTENTENEKDFTIQGVAISSTVTDNGHKFMSEDLKKAVKSLANRPLLKDHNSNVDSIVGKVISAKFDNISESIIFKARVNNTEQGQRVQELIKIGDLATVSVGAVVGRIEEDEDAIIPKDIKFKELSVVATPADDNAQFVFKGNTFSMALQEAYKSNHKSQSLKNDTGDINAEETIKTETNMKSNELKTESDEEKSDDKSEESEDNKAEESTKFSDFELEMKTEMDSMKEQIKGITDLLSDTLNAVKALKEADEDEVKKEDSKPEEKSDDVDEKVDVKDESEDEDDSEDDEDEDSVDEQSKYKVVQKYNSFTVIRNK